MGHSKASATVLQAAQRAALALRLRVEGKTYREIGAALGTSEQAATKVVAKQLRRLQTASAEDAALLRGLQHERLNALLSALWPLAYGQPAEETRGGRYGKKAVPADPDAAAKAVKIIERICALFGLDAPKKVAPTTPDGEAPWKAYAGFDPEQV